MSLTTFAILPAVHIGPGEALRLAGFFGLAWGYMLIFGLVALGATARLTATAGGLLAATVLWLAVTFVLPALTGNINPTAAINPVSALAAAPDTPVFALLGNLLGPVSLAESFKYLSAELMGYLPGGVVPRGAVPPLVSLVLALGLAAGFALAGCLALDPPMRAALMADRSPIVTIALKDAREALRDRFLLVATLALAAGAAVSVLTGALALHTDAATYAAAKALLLALGKDAAAIARPEFWPLKLLRGTIEQVEILGAVIALVAGYRAAVSERGQQTLALILTRPARRWHFLAAKLLGRLLLAIAMLGAVFVGAALLLAMVSGVGLSPADLGRLALVWVASVAYLTGIFAVGFALSLWHRRPRPASLRLRALDAGGAGGAAGGRHHGPRQPGRRRRLQRFRCPGPSRTGSRPASPPTRPSATASRSRR